MTGAQIYIRNNGSFGASCDGCKDTGHHITEDSGRFTVFSVDNEGMPIIENATREQAETAIMQDWRAE